MIVMVSTNTLRARDPDQSERMKPIEMTSNRGLETTWSRVRSTTLLTASSVSSLARQIDDRCAEIVDRPGIDPADDVGDAGGQSEDQWRQRQDRKERRLGSKAGDAIAQAGTDGLRDERARQPRSSTHQGRGNVVVRPTDSDAMELR